MTRKILQLLGLGALIVAATAEEHPAELVGRWRSENMPVGYWVIDRYPDGRLARKEYVRNDSSRPAEIAVTWGRWRMRGAQYGEYFESTTSPSGQGYCGKWWNVRIQRVTPHRFHHLSNDGHDTYEDRLRDRRPLPKVHQPPPRQYRWGKLTNTMTSTAVPKWVISSAPN